MAKPDPNYVMGAVTLLAIVIIIAAVVLYFAISKSQSQTTTTTPGGTQITVTASGTAFSSAAQVSMSMFVNGSGNSSATAIANLSKTLNKVNATLLKYVNGNISLITTQYFNVNKAYNKSTYVAQENLLVIIPNATNVTGALIGLASIPNVYVFNINSKLSAQQTATLRTQALSLAISNATIQANAVSPTGKSMLLNVTINSYYFYPLPYYNGGPGGIATPVAQVARNQTINSLFYSGRSSVTESVTAQFVT